MTIRISRAAKNIGDIPVAPPSDCEYTFWHEGDNATTEFTTPSGWKPSAVFVNGALMRDGEGEDYAVSYNGFLYAVNFSVAPAAVNIGIKAKRNV